MSSKDGPTERTGLLSSAKEGLRRTATLGHAGFAGADKALSEGFGKIPGTYDKLFLKDVNRVFGDHLEVASRGACFVVLCAIPFVMPHEFCSWCDHIVQEKIYTSACVTYFIYTLYVYAGDILHFAKAGVLGTILAVISIWMMQGFMPGGYTASKPHRWWIGSAWGMTFTVLILWLNFDNNTRIFALSTYVWYWMSFIKPDATAGFSQNFEIRFDGKAVREFMIAFIGCGIAVVAAYMPYPIYAHMKALEVAKSMLSQVYMTKQDFLEYYCGAAADPMIVRVLRREMTALHSERGTVAGLLDSAQYENFGSKKWKRQQQMMQQFSDFIGKTLDMMQNAFEICQYESFDDTHVSLMSSIKTELSAMVTGNGNILLECIAALEKGGFDEEMIAECNKCKAEVKTHYTRMTKNLLQARSNAGYEVVSDDVSGENLVALTFAKFNEGTHEFQETLLADQTQALPNWKPSDLMPPIFEPGEIFNKDHIMWTIRNAVSIIISFYIGWVGYGEYIAEYNAAIASTVAVLLSKFVGSAMIKNLARLQGVVIGIVLGNLLYAFLAWCYWWGHLLVALALYLWTLMGLFMYYHSENYSTVGLLLVVFGTSSLLKPCANTETVPSGHSAIVNVTVAICVMTIIDILLSPARASDMALDNFKEAHLAIKQALVDLFDPDKKEIAPRRIAGVTGDTLSDKINAAKSMGGEAALEPRYWRPDWQTSRFDQAISCLECLRFCVDAVESIALEGGKPTEMRQKKQIFINALETDSFKGVVEIPDPTGLSIKQLQELLTMLKINHEKCADRGDFLALLETRTGTGIKDTLVTHMAHIMKAVEHTIGDAASHDVFVDRLQEVTNLQASATYGEVNSDEFKKFWKDMTKIAQKAPRATDDIIKDPFADLSLVVEAVKAMFVSLDDTLAALLS